MDKTIPNKIEAFFRVFPPLSYHKGDTIFQAHESPSGVYHLSRGYVREFTISEHGVELTLHFFKPGAFFPLTWALGNHENTYMFEAATEVEVRRAPKDEVVSFLRQEPDILFELNKRFLSGIEGLLSRIQYLVFGDAHMKVLSAIYFLSKHFGEIQNNIIILNTYFTRREIAAFAGVTRETVSREMEILRRDGFIAYDANSITVCNMASLQHALKPPPV